MGVLATSISTSIPNSISTSLATTAATLANHYPTLTLGREARATKEEVRDHNGADGKATDAKAADGKAADAKTDLKAKKETERPALRTNKEPVTKKIDYHETVNPLVSAVNGVSGKETWC